MLIERVLQRMKENEGKPMAEIYNCVVCGRDLKVDRVHADTCGEGCFRNLLKIQRAIGGYN